MLKIHVAVIFFVFQLNLQAQSLELQRIKFRHLSLENGLSQSSVTSIIQDKTGFLWFGTIDGLNKFDGYTFKKYKFDSKIPGNIPGAYITSLFQDNTGKIWIGTFTGGISVFNPLTEEFSTIKNNSNDSLSISGNDISSICQESDNLFWIATWRNGLNLYNFSTKKTIRIVKGNGGFSLSSNNIRKIIKGKDNKLYLATRGGLNILDYKNHKIVVYQQNANDSNKLNDNKLQNIFEDKRGKIWISTRNSGIFCFDPLTTTFKQYKHDETDSNSISSNYINCIFEAKNGLIWIGTYDDGINILNPADNSILRLTENSGDKFSLSSNHIFTIFEDRQNIIWVGTDVGGINYYHPQFEIFTSMNTIWGDIKTTDHNNIFSIIEDENEKLWVGTNGAGVYKMTHSYDQLVNFANSSENSNSISYNSVWSLLNFNKDTIFIGTNGKGFNILNKVTYKISRYISDSIKSNTLSSDVILCMFKENDSLVWLGTISSGINIFNTRTSKFEYFKNNPEDHKSIASNVIFSIQRISNSSILVGTQAGGLNIFQKGEKKFLRFQNKANDYFSISNNDVKCIYESKNGTIWLGTEGGGLNAFDIKSKHFIYYTEKDGLPNNVIYGIEEDRKGNLWLSTNNGICRFTPPDKINFNSRAEEENKAKQIRNFNTSDGILSNEFNQGAYFQDQAGWMFFGNIKGITRFHPDSVKNEQINTSVYFTKFSVFDKKFPLDTLIEIKKQIRLKYNQNFFSFEFATLNFLSPEKNQYAVKMVGFDPDWIYTGNRRYASYTNLDPGEYDFKVKATNNDGLWSDKIASVHITITPPFWKTTWFRILSAFLLLSSVIAYFRYRVNNIRKEEQKKAAFERELAEVEMKALRAQMNPHFIFNSLNSINKYIWANDQASASDYLARFSRLIRLIFENSMHQSVPLSSDLEALDLYIQMERLRFENKLNYTIKVDESIDQEQVLVPPLIFQPFVENAILHGIMPKGTMGNLTININTTENDLIVTIEDNGIGRAAAAEKNKNRGNHKSLGMKVTKDRLDLLNQKKSAQSSVIYSDLLDEPGNSSGTRVEITLPIEYV